MAVQTLYVLATNAVTPNFWGNLQLNGTAPTGANSAFGWAVARTAVTTPYYRARLGATAVGGDAASSTTTIGVAPRKGTGTGASTAGDSFIAGPFTGTFAVSPWTFNFNLRAGTAGAVGHINMTMWRGANADGSGATMILGQTPGATVTLSTTTDVNSSISTASMGGPTLNNEYLFFQIEWQETTAGTSNNNNILFRAGTSFITTADFVPVTAGALAVTQANQTVSAAGWATARGTLAATQANHTIFGRGGPVVRGTLALTEISDTISASGSNGSAAPNHLITSFTPGAFYNTFTGRVGGMFAVSAAATFNQLGLYSMGDVSAGTWTVILSDYDTQANYFQTDIVMPTGIPSGGWYYVPVPNGISIAAGTRYVLSVAVTSGGTPFMNESPVTIRLSTTVYSVYAPGGGLNFTLSQANAQDVGIDLIEGAPFIVGRLGDPTMSTPLAVDLLVHADGAPGSTAFVDSSGNNWPLTPTGTAQIGSNAKFGGGAISFDASTSVDSHIVVGGTSDFNIPGFTPFTIEAWVWFNSDPTAKTRVITSKWGGSDCAWMFFIYQGTFLFGYTTIGTDFQGVGVTNFAPTDYGKWFHLAVTGDATGFRVYINGSLAGSGYRNNPMWQSTNLTEIGNQSDGGSTLAFDGYIDELTITIGASRYTDVGFIPPLKPYRALLDPGYLAQAPQTLSAFGTVSNPVSGNVGTLNLTQANQTLFGTATVTVGGTLGLTQQPQTLAATGGVAVGATLGLTQAPQTIAAAGGVTVTGTLGLTQQPQALAAVGRVLVGGALGLTQQSQTLLGTAKVAIGGTLGLTQAPQTLSAFGSVVSPGVIVGNLILTQDDHVLSATGTVPANDTGIMETQYYYRRRMRR